MSAEEKPGYFTLLDSSSPAYTEPYWDPLFFQVYPVAASGFSSIALAAGAGSLVLSILVASWLNGILMKEGLL